MSRLKKQKMARLTNATALRTQSSAITESAMAILAAMRLIFGAREELGEVVLGSMVSFLKR